MNIKNKFLITALVVGIFLFIGIYSLNRIYVFPILMYHSIDENPQNSKLIVSPDDFRAQMNFLKRHKFRVISLAELIDSMKANERLPRKTVAITFDDGYQNNFTYAYPILKENGFPATIFVIVDSIGKEGYLTGLQLRQMHLHNIDIGSHSLTHAYLPGLKEKDLFREIFGSKRTLEEILRGEIKFFCYPVGGFNDKIKNLVESAGYSGACTTSPGRHFSDHDIFALKRVRVSGGRNNLLVFGIKSSGYHTWIKEHRDED